MHGGMAPAVRAAAERRWRNLLIFERGVRQWATERRDEYIARAALRSWVAAVLGREPGEPGAAFVADRFEAEAMAGRRSSPIGSRLRLWPGARPLNDDLAPYRATAEAVALEVFVSVVAREFASIRQALEA